MYSRSRYQFSRPIPPIESVESSVDEEASANSTIPLPDGTEVVEDMRSVGKSKINNSLVRFLKKNFQLDDLIVLGVIILLFTEFRNDSFRDNNERSNDSKFIMPILIYLFISGKLT